jgi:simple sugar transport system ATP-binding protein
MDHAVNAPSPPPPAFALHNVSKQFGTVQALVGVDLDVRAGEIHALIGENGAGKSTLVNVVAGLVHPDTGTMSINGTPVAFAHRRDASAAGIGVVHQHFSLVETLTVVENLQLGRPGSTRLLQRGRARADLAVWSERTGLAADPDAVVGALSVSERQRVEVLTALTWGARVLLLDEPTAVLSPLESDALLGVVRRLAVDEGLAVLFVTHKLREVEAVADRVTVLRGGVVTGRHEGAGIDRAVLAAEMIGDERHAAPPAPATPGAVRLSARGVAVGRLHGVDLDLRAGEIVGIAGVAGNGQNELVRVLAGLVPPSEGTVRLTTEGAERSRERSRVVAYVPEDRAADALAGDLAVWVNAVAKRTREVGDWRGVNRRKADAFTARVIERLGVRPAQPKLPASALSGGNQQRLVIGRELDGDPAVVLAAEPTRGLDPGSALDVIEALRTAASRGAAVLVVSSDLDELLLIAQRIVVMYDGRLVLDVPRADATRAGIGRAMVGA